MFNVRVPRPPALSRALPVRADCVAAIHSALTPVPGPHSSHAACPPFDSAGRVCVQPAAQLRHVQGHEHGRHVRSALRACPGPHSLESGPPRARRLRRRHPAPSRSRAVPLPTSHARLSTRQYALAFNQPLSFDTSSVTNMHNMFDYASAFNQPLSFDTSMVTDFTYMFYVRSPLAPPAPHAPLVGPAPLCMLLSARLPHTPSHRSSRSSPRSACPPFGSAGHALLLRREQAAHSLRLEGQPGLRFCLRSDLGSG